MSIAQVKERPRDNRARRIISGEAETSTFHSSSCGSFLAAVSLEQPYDGETDAWDPRTYARTCRGLCAGDGRHRFCAIEQWKQWKQRQQFRLEHGHERLVRQQRWRRRFGHGRIEQRNPEPRGDWLGRRKRWHTVRQCRNGIEFRPELLRNEFVEPVPAGPVGQFVRRVRIVHRRKPLLTTSLGDGPSRSGRAVLSRASHISAEERF